MSQQDEQVIDQIGRFMHHVLLACIGRLGTGFDDFVSFLDDLVADLGNAALKQARRVGARGGFTLRSMITGINRENTLELDISTFSTLQQPPMA